MKQLADSCIAVVFVIAALRKFDTNARRLLRVACVFGKKKSMMGETMRSKKVFSLFPLWYGTILLRGAHSNPNNRIGK